MTEMQAFRDAVSGWATDGPGGPASDLAVRLEARRAVLLEGLSDLAAVEALAARRGRDLAAEGVCVVPMGGAMSVGRYAGLLGPPGLALRLAGLCDKGEQRFYGHGLRRAQAPRQAFFVSGTGTDPHNHHPCHWLSPPLTPTREIAAAPRSNHGP